MMNKRILMIIAASALIVILTIIFIAMPKNRDYKKDLQFISVEKGDVKSMVSCTGTISAKGTVEIGTQVSGTVSSVGADYNDNVKKDQILATLDTTLLQITVDQAEADLTKANNQYQHLLKQYDDNVLLHNDKLISDFDFEAIKVSKNGAYADKLSAEANLKKAKANYANAIIRSPIEGTVIDRNVEVGQTVAASLSSPTLFIIAENLSNMEINALVDENDIGSIKLNQNATFTVESYPDEEFTGKVSQIRLKPTTVSNVVNYTIIIDAPNPKRILLPGMTANIDIITDERSGVLLVSNNALKFKPTQSMLAELKKNSNGQTSYNNVNNSQGGNDRSGNNTQSQRSNDNLNGGSSNNPQNRQRGNGQNDGGNFAQYRQRSGDNSSDPKGNAQNRQRNASMLYYIDKDNNLKAMYVRTGLSDGQKTEVSGKNISEGMKVIVSAAANTKQNTNNNGQNNRGPNFGPRLF
jgi:HlyD family secretion protein